MQKYFKIANASHEPDFWDGWNSKNKTWKLQSCLDAPSLLVEMKKQNPINYKPFLKIIHGLLRYPLEITFSEVLMDKSGYQASYLSIKTLSFTNESNNILEESENFNYSFD